MSVAGTPSLHQDRAEASRLVWALVISLAIHLFFFGSYYGAKKLLAWYDIHHTAWLRPLAQVAELLNKKPNPLQPRQQEAPLMFVEVTPLQATTEPPKDAKYYSDKSSKAANPDANKDTATPLINGKQTDIAKTDDVPRPKFVPLQPTPPPQPAQKELPELKPRPTPEPGDLTMAKPEPSPPKDPGEAPVSRPRTIAEALARKQDFNRLAGEKMKEEGGVSRRFNTSLDVKGTPFGAYDYAFIQAVEQHWYDLLDERQYASDSRGRVVLHFTLHYDGRVTDMEMAENTAGEVLGLICEKAVLDPAPFQPWPIEMRRVMGETRNIQFTFIYY
ncbi:MAG TPA: hypothetical protein VG146_08590 [Verrucomicrobiae bacterium]|nr:hypothetical protein [Verrucomicrobiae bacterium]